MGKELVWLHGEIKTPPFSVEARREAGFHLRDLQEGRSLAMPHSRPMPSIGARVHELRIVDEDQTWRVIYRVDEDAIVIAGAFSKKTPQTPKLVINTCKRRYREYDAD
jgi:phage-related protein